MNMHTSQPVIADFEAIKAKQNATWASGDYGRIGIKLQWVGENLAEALDLPFGSSVLDVAAGNGNATMAMARQGNRVTSTDYVDTLLAQGKVRAAGEGMDVRFQIADAEALPFEDGEFDATVSTFGVMFAPNQSASAAELVRVTRSGGKIGMANWTIDGFIGQLFKAIGKHVPPPAGVRSPANWGEAAWIEETFSGVGTIQITPKDFIFRHPSPDHFVDEFRAVYGPVHKAFLALDTAGQDALHADIVETINRFNTNTDGTMRVPAAYSEVVITKA